MKSKSFRVIGLLLLPMLIVLNTWAEEPTLRGGGPGAGGPGSEEGVGPGPGGPGREGGLLRIVEELDLTAEQRQKIRELRYEEKRSRMELQHRSQILELDLQYELEKSQSDEAKISKIVEDLKQVYGEKLNQRVRSILALRQVLTPEQYEKLRSLGFRGMKKGMKKPRGIRGPGGMGDGL